MSSLSQKRKVFIILWKWDHLTHVNANTFRKREFEDYADDIHKAKDKGFYDECSVQGSNQCPDALLVRASIYNDNEQTKKLFLALIGKYSNKDSEVLLLLHRANFYEKHDMEQIIHAFRNFQIKCFLFSDGRDYIYYMTRKAGLLDDSGKFFGGRDPDTGEYIEVCDSITNTVKQPYFDRTWSFYRYESNRIVLALRKEMYDVWMEFLLPNSPDLISVSDLKAHLGHLPDRLLEKRISNFLGKSNGLDGEIEQLENKDGVSYFFDDDLANILKRNDNTKAADAYEKIQALLDRILYGEEAFVSKDDLRTLSGRFDEIVGEIF
jgi:hypothetical protein